MDADTLRTLIRTRIAELGLTTHRAARLAGLPDQTARDYLGGADLRTRQALQLAAGVGLAVTAARVPDFDPGGGPLGVEKKSRKSGKKVANRD